MNLSKVIINLKDKKNVNYNKYLRATGILEELEVIKHSYDLQAGSYVRFFLNNKERENKYCKRLLFNYYERFIPLITKLE